MHAPSPSISASTVRPSPGKLAVGAVVHRQKSEWPWSTRAGVLFALATIWLLGPLGFLLAVPVAIVSWTWASTRSLPDGLLAAQVVVCLALALAGLGLLGVVGRVAGLGLCLLAAHLTRSESLL